MKLINKKKINPVLTQSKTSVNSLTTIQIIWPAILKCTDVYICTFDAQIYKLFDVSKRSPKRISTITSELTCKPKFAFK